jgi:hypothetical protein
MNADPITLAPTLKLIDEIQARAIAVGQPCLIITADSECARMAKDLRDRNPDVPGEAITLRTVIPADPQQLLKALAHVGLAMAESIKRHVPEEAHSLVLNAMLMQIGIAAEASLTGRAHTEATPMHQDEDEEDEP